VALKQPGTLAQEEYMEFLKQLSLLNRLRHK
jgi:hypothetical protein